MLQGGVHVIGPLGVDPAEDIGFDISANDGVAYAVMGPAGDPQSTLYRVNLSAGAAVPVGVIGAAERVRAFAVFSRSVTTYLLTTNRELVTVKSGVAETIVSTVVLSPGPDTSCASTRGRRRVISMA